MVREYTESDLGAILALHTGDYRLDLDSPLILNKLVSIDASATIIAAGLHRVCYETCVLVNPSARPQEKWAALRELNHALSTRAYEQGLDITHASVPPIGFEKRLLQLGWVPDRPGWRLWSLETKGGALSGAP